MSAFAIYLIGMADSLRIFLQYFGGCLAIACTGLLYLGFLSESTKGIKLAFIAIVFSLLISVSGFFVPSTKILISMIVIPSLTNNAEVQKLPINILRFVNDYLEREDK